MGPEWLTLAPQINFYWLLPISCIGFIITLFIRTNIRDRILPRQPGEIARMRVGTRLVLWKSPCTFQRLTRDEEDTLWNDYLVSQGFVLLVFTRFGTLSLILFFRSL